MEQKINTTHRDQSEAWNDSRDGKLPKAWAASRLSWTATFKDTDGAAADLSGYTAISLAILGQAQDEAKLVEIEGTVGDEDNERVFDFTGPQLDLLAAGASEAKLWVVIHGTASGGGTDVLGAGSLRLLASGAVQTYTPPEAPSAMAESLRALVSDGYLDLGGGLKIVVLSE